LPPEVGHHIEDVLEGVLFVAELAEEIVELAGREGGEVGGGGERGQLFVVEDFAFSG
jgi:hypothetical protein